MKTREEALALDRDDPLAPLREQFALPAGVIYLDGNSLGAQPRAAAARAQQVIGAEWGEGLIRSWNTAGWFALPRRLGDRLAPLIGAADDEVAITDTISINLFKLLAAMLRHQARHAPKRRVIVSERSNFPTDLYIAQGLIAQLDRDYELRLIDDPADLPDALDDETAVAMITHVNYRTGYMHDMPSVTQTVRQAGALMLWDLAHSAGAVPVDLNGALADGAVGCTYKYLNGGPGSPAFVWVPKRHQRAFEQPLSGWWAIARHSRCSPRSSPIRASRAFCAARSRSCRCRWSNAGSTCSRRPTCTRSAANRSRSPTRSSRSSNRAARASRSSSSRRARIISAARRRASSIRTATR
ncbi:hypothetical protein BMMON3_15940 [Burkholderia mallei]